MITDKSLEENIRREATIKKLFEQKVCILEIQPGSIVSLCSNYSKKSCYESEYRNECNYALKFDKLNK